MDKPVLSKQAFWDVDMDKVDYEKNALFVMERVATKGTMDDFVSLIKFYSKDRWREEIINSKELDDRDASFCCHIFDLKKEGFKYDIKPFLREPWELYGA
jgi:hypothetical protein